jgi:hypothetical protein
MTFYATLVSLFARDQGVPVSVPRLDKSTVANFVPSLYVLEEALVPVERHNVQSTSLSTKR